MNYKEKLKERTRLINEYRRAGKATALDILKADFGGTWPPKGLFVDGEEKIPGYLNTPVKISNFPVLNEDWRVEMANRQPEWDTIARPEIVAMAHDFLEYGFSFMAGMAFAEISNIFLNEAVLESGGYVLRRESQHIRLNPLIAMMSKSSKAGTISHENIHVLQYASKKFESDSTFKDEVFHEKIQKNKSKLKHAIYLSEDKEIMARMHLIISSNYLLNETLPHNFQQLCTLMGNLNIPIATSSISEELVQLFSQEKQTYSKANLKQLKKVSKGSVTDFKKMCDFIKPEYKRIASYRLLCSYTDLLSLYSGQNVSMSSFLERSLKP